MTILFIKDILSGLFPWLEGKRLLAYFLLQGDVVILLLILILYFEVKRWQRLKDR